MALFALAFGACVSPMVLDDDGGSGGEAGSGGSGTGGSTAGSNVAGDSGGAAGSAAGGNATPTGAVGGGGAVVGTGAAGGGSAGAAGTAGPTGVAGHGTGGAAGTTGTAGTIGAAGTTGTAGTIGAAGTTGAAGSGGTPGLGAWTTGYAATMYGDDTSGDCAGLSNFGDMTNIRSQTCTTVVTISSFTSSTDANNAAYYGAVGDLSSLWDPNGVSVAECSCNGNDTCPSNQAPSCPGESTANGACGICVAVKCDPNGTFSLGGTTHDSDCGTTQYAVIQIIDACPHDHPTNVASSEGWCTSRQAQHIDLSCSALGGISTLGTAIGRDGWLNVDVQKVPCSLGLGLHPL